MAVVLFNRLRSAAEQGLAIGAHRLVDRVPVTGQLCRHF